MRFIRLLRNIAVLSGFRCLPAIGCAETVTDADGQAASRILVNVAIIGAGAAGSSAAYYLNKFAQEEGVILNITIFEKANRVGGRTLTVNIHDRPLEPVELGASIFIEGNHVLWDATKRLGLPSKRADLDERGLLTVWDGDKFVFEQEQAGWQWWNLAKLFWKYGRAPYRTNRLVKATSSTLMKLYQTPFFPFRSLTQRAFELGLAQITAQTGQQFLDQNGIAALFAHDIIQAGTRTNYASNLGDIHGLGTLAAMAAERPRQILGGNWRIFDGLVRESGASLLLNTSLSSIELEPIKEPGMVHERFWLKTRNSNSAEATEQVYPLIFDKVIIAAPYQFSNITAAADVMQHPIEEIPYVTLHVTLLTSPFRISPAFYKFAPVAKPPTSILTTLAESDDTTPGSAGAGKAGFFSIQTRGKHTNPRSLRDEFLYHILSPSEITPQFLSSMLGVKIPETFTGLVSPDETEIEVMEPISWYHAHVFHAYPRASPRVSFQDPIIRAGLFYTSGMEAFISTMEISALMGMNVAKLIMDDLLGIPGRAGADDLFPMNQEQQGLKDDRTPVTTGEL